MTGDITYLTTRWLRAVHAPVAALGVRARYNVLQLGGKAKNAGVAGAFDLRDHADASGLLERATCKEQAGIRTSSVYANS